VLQLLAEAGMLETEEPPPRALALRQWEFHDLLFHARSRGWHHDAGTGGTRRFAGQLPSLPAVKPPTGGAIVELSTPDLEALRRDDAPFTDVLERRRSIRARGAAPLTAQQLSEFLFRCARVRQVHASEQDATSDRPYPGAGARYELEVYPVVHACDGIPSGLYHYCPERHVLERLEGEPAAVRALLEGARSPEPPHELPDVLLILAARFQRVAWRYESIAYSLILKDVGVLFQTMYLVATAMRLAPCAIGHGDPDLFSRAAGTDRHVESSVGEFTLSAG
jgi:SagB-type dehydrogenase family enzyme